MDSTLTSLSILDVKSSASADCEVRRDLFITNEIAHHLDSACIDD